MISIHSNTNLFTDPSTILLYFCGISITSLTVKESPSAAMTLTSAALTYSTRTEDKQGNSHGKDKQTHEAIQAEYLCRSTYSSDAFT